MTSKYVLDKNTILYLSEALEVSLGLAVNELPCSKLIASIIIESEQIYILWFVLINVLFSFSLLDIIDPAVLRPGRLDKTLYVGLPPPADRHAILLTITKVTTTLLYGVPSNHIQ